MRKFKLVKIVLVSINLAFLSNCQNSKWEPLFDGKKLPPYNHYLGIPDSSINIPGLKKDSLGNYIEGLGWNDPLNVYSVVSLEGKQVIRISGQVIGGLILSENLANYHLRLKFKWGKIKWEWMKGRPKDGGILYHQRKRIRHELQIHEGDVGSYWAKKVILDIPASYSSEIPEAIVKAKPFLQPLVSTLHDTMLVFNHDAPLHHFDGGNGGKDWQIVIANPYNEKPHGEWNTLELICWENHAVHLVNGKVNLVVLNAHFEEDGKLFPLVSGNLTLQSEGAEIYFKDIQLKKLDSTPAELIDYL
ncbi:MAG: DUF1080 domain-containing protein [Bacteroidota bacterium]